MLTALTGCQPQDMETEIQPEGERVSQAPPEDTEPTLVDLHHQILTLDSHIDIPTQLGLDAADPAHDGPMQVDFPKMRSGGLDSGFFIVYVAQDEVSPEGYAMAYEQAQAKFAGIERMLQKYPQEIGLATTPDELRGLVAEGKLAAAIGIENAFPLGQNLEHLQEFYDRGGRYVSLTHFGHNHFGDSSVGKGDYESMEEPTNEGLSDLGKELIDRMNRLGMMVDVSHTAPSTTLQSIEYSALPVIASHSGVRTLFDHPRNLSDEEILAIAETGGVIQLVAFDGYMREFNEENKAAIAAIRENMGLDQPGAFQTVTQSQLGELRAQTAALNSQWPRASVATLVDHIDYVVDLVGIDHAGISSDFGGGGGVQGWDHAGETQAVTDELLARGYSLADIEKIWSGNLLRVWQEVENFAAAVRDKTKEYQ